MYMTKESLNPFWLSNSYSCLIVSLSVTLFVRHLHTPTAIEIEVIAEIKYDLRIQLN